MAQYLLSIVQPDGEPPAPEILHPIMADLASLNDEMRAAGVWVFGAGLHPPSTASVVRAGAGDPIITDGPFAEGTEHVGGFTIIAVDDLDAALAWGRRLSATLTLPIEVRPLAGDVIR